MPTKSKPYYKRKNGKSVNKKGKHKYQPSNNTLKSVPYNHIDDTTRALIKLIANHFYELTNEPDINQEKLIEIFGIKDNAEPPLIDKRKSSPSKANFYQKGSFWIALVMCILALSPLCKNYFFRDSMNPDFPDRDLVIEFINNYREITNGNNYPKGELLYASTIEKYYDSEMISRDSVMKLFRNYSKSTKSRGKNSTIDYETLEIIPLNSNTAVVTFFEYFHLLDRDDKSKDSIFHIKKFFVINNEYKIVKEYEERK